MGRKLRRIAGLVTVILGLLLVTVAGYSLVRDDPKTSTAAESAGVQDPKVGQVDPVDPGGSSLGPVSRSDAPPENDVFAKEYGDRGKHKVTLTIRGTYYKVEWRDGQKDQGRGGMTNTRTLNGGFPIVGAFVVGQGSRASCTVSVDGVEKTSESATKVPGAVWCAA